MSKLRHKYIAQRFQMYVDANLSAPIYSTEVSRQLGVSERTLYTAVASNLGLSPHRFIHLQRLRRAHTVLATGLPKTKILSIAQDCGFNHAGEFAKAYRLQFGETPSETVLRARRMRLAAINHRATEHDRSLLRVDELV